MNSPRGKVKDDHVPAVGSRSPELSPHCDPTASAQWGYEATYLFSGLGVACHKQAMLLPGD